MTPYSDITFAIVVWNDAERLRRLLEHVRPFFETLAVAVQESPDDTLYVALELADIVVKDKHRGFGDATFGPRLLPQVTTKWTFKCDADEWPTDLLLGHLRRYVDEAERAGAGGVWVPFRSWVDDLEYEEQHSHLRLFRTAEGWPETMHSRPSPDVTLTGDVGHVEHRRSLDEMMRDYLSYYEKGMRNPAWVDHNRLMMKSACDGVAAVKGWHYVRSWGWWPQVRDAAYEGRNPKMVVYCAGAARTGTRLLYDIVTALGESAVHAVLPGYHDIAVGEPDLANPVWWKPSEMEEMYGRGPWIVIERDKDAAAQSAIRVGKAKDKRAYARMASRAAETLQEVIDDGAMVIEYEYLVREPKEAIDAIADFLGVDSVTVDGIFDGNAKYRSETGGKKKSKEA